MRFNPDGMVESLTESMDRMLDFDGAGILKEGALSLDDIWGAIGGEDAGKFEVPDEKPEAEPEARPDLESDYIEDAKRLSKIKAPSRDYSDEERKLIGGTQTKGLPEAVGLMIGRFAEGKAPSEFSDTMEKMRKYPELDASDYIDFVLNYVKANGLEGFSSAAGKNLGWENEHIAKAVGDQSVQDELTAIQKDRDSKLAGLPSSEKDRWSPEQADAHLGAMSKTGDVLRKAMSAIPGYKPREITASIDEIYKKLPNLVNSGIKLRLEEYDFERAYRKIMEILGSMRTQKNEMPGVVSKMMGGLEPYSAETVTNPRTGEKTRRWDLVHGRIDKFTAPVSSAELRREIQNLPASQFESEFYALKMPYAEKICSMISFLYPEMRHLDKKAILDKFVSNEERGDDSMLEGIATRFFRIIKSKRMTELSGEASREADEERKNREYLQQSADAYRNFNSERGDEAEEETASVLSKLPVSDRNKMVSIMVQNKIVPGNELFRYLDGISNGRGGMLGEARVFRPEGELPPDLPPRPGSADDFMLNPETGDLARRPETGTPIRVNRDSVRKAAMQDLKNSDAPVRSQAIGIGNRYPGTVEPEQFVEILDAYLGHRTFEEGAVSLSQKTADFMSNRAARGRGRQSANAGRLASWYADFIDMLNETPEEERRQFFDSCRRGGYPIDESMLTDWNAPESERVSLGRAYLLFNWVMKSGQPASAISINSLFLPDTNGLAQHLFKSRVLYSPNEGKPIVWGGDKRGDYFGTRDEALAKVSVPESFSKYDSSFDKIYSEILFG